MPPRIHTDLPLAASACVALPPGASRHVQVLRLQPGNAITLFDGHGGEWAAEVAEMGRKTVTARVMTHQAVDCELVVRVDLAVGMPANDRMDGLVEKATELGAAALQPLVCERSVLRLSGERAERKAAHWQGIAVAACEQSGRNRVPRVHQPLPLAAWLAGLPPAGNGELRLVLSLADGTQTLRTLLAGCTPGTALCVLSGPEGGLSSTELAAATAAGFQPTSLGPRVLRADTAPLAVLASVATLENPA